MSPPTAPRIGVISNLRSRQNLRGMPAIRAVLAERPAVLHRELRSRDDDPAAVRDLAEAGVEIVVQKPSIQTVLPKGTIKSAA